MIQALGLGILSKGAVAGTFSDRTLQDVSGSWFSFISRELSNRFIPPNMRHGRSVMPTAFIFSLFGSDSAIEQIPEQGASPRVASRYEYACR